MPEPMYRQIADHLRRQIESHEIAPGSQLPTELELTDRYEASRNTVRDAIKLLTTRGLVETRPGQGTFVIEKIQPFLVTLSGDPAGDVSTGEDEAFMADVQAQHRASTISPPRVEIQLADSSVAAALELEIGTQVVSRHQQRFIDGMPWSVQTSFYPMALVQAGATHLIQATDIRGGTLVYLRGVLGIRQIGYQDTITVRPPDENETAFFKLPGDGRIGVFEVRRAAFSEDHKPFHLTISVYPVDRNQFVVNVGEVPTGTTASPPLHDDGSDKGKPSAHTG
jgi:GntR family transcriptional regulator